MNRKEDYEKASLMRIQKFLDLFGYVIVKTNNLKKWNVVATDNFGGKHIVGTISNVVVDRSAPEYNDYKNKNDNEYEIQINSKDIECHDYVGGVMRYMYIFHLKRDDVDKYEWSTVELSDGYLKVFTHGEPEYGNITYHEDMHKDYKSLVLNYIVRTVDNRYDELYLTYNSSKDNCNEYLKQTASVEGNIKNCPSNIIVSDLKGISTTIFSASYGTKSIYDYDTKTLKMTTELWNDGICKDKTTSTSNMTLKEIAATDDEVIGYIKDFFDLLREKVFPFYKGDVIDYLIDTGVINMNQLEKIFPQLKNHAGLVRTKISN